MTINILGELNELNTFTKFVFSPNITKLQELLNEVDPRDTLNLRVIHGQDNQIKITFRDCKNIERSTNSYDLGQDFDYFFGNEHEVILLSLLNELKGELRKGN